MLQKMHMRFQNQKNMNFEIIKVVHEILYNNKNAELELKLLAEKLN